MKQLVSGTLILVWMAGLNQLAAQTGTITGRVLEAETAEPIVNVVILATSLTDSTKQTWVYSDGRGMYALGEIPVGYYTVSFMSVAHHTRRMERISVLGAQSVRLDAELVPRIIMLDGIVVSASRKQQKLLEAPASMSVIDARAVAEAPVITPTDHLRTVAGVDVSQTGLLQQNVVVRGFNNVFSGTLMMLTDNRLAGVPSLRLNAPYLLAPGNDDIERVEVVRGPGSALYGPNAANGVVNFITSSPFSSKGTSVSTTMGERSVFQGTFRHAGSVGNNAGYKFSGLYFKGKDWSYVDPVETAIRQDALAAGADASTLRIGKREGVIERYAGEARLDFLLGDQLSAVATFGMTQLVRGIELTDIGAAQAKDWNYSYAQARVSYGDLFAQAFFNKSDAGDTYLLRSGEPIVDRSSQFVTQIQHSVALSDAQRFIYGADLLLTRPETGGTINGRNEASDDINEYGGYLQSETRLFDNHLDLAFAARIDKHNQLLSPVFSPRAGITLRPNDHHNIRVTYNRAYSTPTTTELFLDIESVANVFGFPEPYAIAVRASGVPTSGFNFDRIAGRPVMHSPFFPAGPIPADEAALLWSAVVDFLAAGGVDLSGIPAPTSQEVGSLMALLNPETGSFDPVSDVYDIKALKPTITQTLEVGYKGVFSSRLQASVDIYYTRVTDFIGPLQIFTPNVFLNGDNVKDYLKPYIKQGLMDQGVPEPQAEAIAEDQATQIGASVGQIPLGTVTPKEAESNTAILLASRNFGTVNLQGIDLWADYRLSGMISLEGTYSYVSRNFFEKLDGATDLSLNAPRSKGSIAVAYRNAEYGLFSKLRYRWTEGFRMNSGVYVGSVSPGSFIDVTLGLQDLGFRGFGVTLSSTNLLNKKHRYFIGAPEIGRMVIGRLSYAF
ncbi:MAG: TonB-dependent receptor [Ignavibacteriales bacterium]|nr:TonB-dependent receptor [Ignavibacteriales bacterium]